MAVSTSTAAASVLPTIPAMSSASGFGVSKTASALSSGGVSQSSTSAATVGVTSTAAAAATTTPSSGAGGGAKGLWMGVLEMFVGVIMGILVGL